MERLKISIGKTYNLGNYESLRLDVGLEVEHEKSVEADLFAGTSIRVGSMLKELEERYNV